MKVFSTTRRDNKKLRIARNSLWGGGISCVGYVFVPSCGCPKQLGDWHCHR